MNMVLKIIHILMQLKCLAKKEGALVVPVCAAIESEIAELDDEDKLAFLESMHLTEPGLNRVIRAGYALLDFKPFSPLG